MYEVFTAQSLRDEFGRQRPTYLPGAEAADVPPGATPLEIKAWAEDQLWALVDLGCNAVAFTRDGGDAARARAIFVAVRQAGGFPMVKSVFDELERRIDEALAEWEASAAVNALEHRAAEVNPEWPI